MDQSLPEEMVNHVDVSRLNGRLDGVVTLKLDGLGELGAALTFRTKHQLQR